jgi:hypothetical protein
MQVSSITEAAEIFMLSIVINYYTVIILINISCFKIGYGQKDGIVDNFNVDHMFGRHLVFCVFFDNTIHASASLSTPRLFPLVHYIYNGTSKW